MYINNSASFKTSERAR